MPNLERLAHEGIRFHQFYATAPVCSPTRCALLTGCYPLRWNLTSYLSTREANARRGMPNWLPSTSPSIARALRNIGYRTGHFGKWHLGGQRDVDDAPWIAEYGFDESLTNFEGLGPRLLGLCDAYDGRPLIRHSLGSERLGRGPIVWVNRSRLTSHYAEAALHFIDKASRDGVPFYVHLWPDDVHSPWYPPRARRGDGTRKALYRGVVESMDEQLGPLFQYLQTNVPLRTNTIVLVLSDNGPEPGAGSPGPFRGSKWSLYEGGIRSPLIVWAPGLIPPSRWGTTDSNSVWSTLDVPPSLLRIAGADLSMWTMDGEDMSDVLLGRRTAYRPRPLFWCRPPDFPRIEGAEHDQPDLGMREGRWKLLCTYDGRQPELYDMDSDPGERTNLATQHPELAARMMAAVTSWYRQRAGGWAEPEHGPP